MRSRRETTLSVLLRTVKHIAHTLILFHLISASVMIRAQSGHKSQAELANMTPEQRVEEYRKEMVRHSYTDPNYSLSLSLQIARDGLKALPFIVPLIDQYDPSRKVDRGGEKDLACYGAEGLLGVIDENTTRLRATEEGLKAVEAVSRLVSRMKAAGFDTSDDDHRRYRYLGSQTLLASLIGVNGRDEVMRQTLRIRYNLNLTDAEFTDFCQYLILEDPSYPSWSENEFYKDVSQRTEGGFFKQYLLLKNGEPYYKMYLKYKARQK